MKHTMPLRGTEYYGIYDILHYFDEIEFNKETVNWNETSKILKKKYQLTLQLRISF